MNDKTKALLERVIKLATGVSCLHGRYELGKEGYEELRGIQKEAMGLIKGEGPKFNDVMTFYGIKCIPDPNIPPNAGIVLYRTTPKGVTVKTLPSPAPPTHLHFKADGSVDIAGHPAPTEELWHGYRKNDVIHLAHQHFPKCQWTWQGKDLTWSNPNSGNEGVAGAEYFRGFGLRRPDEHDYKKLG